MHFLAARLVSKKGGKTAQDIVRSGQINESKNESALDIVCGYTR
jgi:hypothetical protein